MGLIFAGDLIGCKKDMIKEYSVKETLDFMGPDQLNELLSSANSIDDLPEKFKTEAEILLYSNDYIPFGDNDVTIKNALLSFSEYTNSNYVLTDLERTKLKNGDSVTYETVLNRMTNIPSYIKNEFSTEFQQKLKDSYFSTYLIMSKNISTDPENYNYLKLSEELESVHASYTIKTIDLLIKLAAKKSTQCILIEIVVGIAIIIIGISIIIPYIPGWICGWFKK
jgi:ubiquinone/menaquinone biosynthesis C-methylase UbiE